MRVSPSRSCLSTLGSRNRFLSTRTTETGSAGRRVALKTGDYTVEGMESLLSLERKSLANLVACTVADRRRFLASCSRLARFRWKAILIEATLEDIKGGLRAVRHPLRGPSQCCLAARWTLSSRSLASPSSTSTVKDLATERAASWLSKQFTYWWLEQQGHGRVLIDSDGL